MFHHRMFQTLAPLLGRLLLGAIFVWAGYGKLTGFDGLVSTISSKGIPLPQIAAAATVIIELVGGLMLVVGLKVRWAALVIFLFLIPVTALFHPYWDSASQGIAFFKNLSIMGGLLMVMLHGAGPISVDRRIARKANAEHLAIGDRDSDRQQPSE